MNRPTYERMRETLKISMEVFENTTSEILKDYQNIRVQSVIAYALVDIAESLTKLRTIEEEKIGI